MLRVSALAAFLGSLGIGFLEQVPVLLDLKTPADMVLLASADCAKLGKDVAYYTRYLDLASIAPDQREEAYLVLCGHMQHLSRSSDIVRPQIVPGTRGALLRINLYDYGIDTEVWEQLAEVDPYYHAQVKAVEKIPVYYPGGYASDGKWYPAQTYYKDGKVSVKTALAPWLAPTKEHQLAMSKLVALTDTSAPVVRGDWFFNQSAAQVDRKPGYYDFLGVKDQKTFEKLIGFDQKLFEGFSIELRASVAISGVTLQPRAIARRQALGGGYWVSYDFKKAEGQNNPLEVLGADIEKGVDASEIFGQLANGFWATALWDKNGKLQDAAPDFIASDGLSKSNDRRVHVNASCIRCHVEGGLKPIDDWARNLLQPPLVLQSYDYGKLKELRQQYLRKLEPFLAKDRLTFDEAVKEATGWTAKEYSVKYATFWESFEDRKVTIEIVERDTGVPREQVLKALEKSIAAGYGDPILSALTKKDMAIPQRVWLSKYAKCWEILNSFKEAQK